MRLSSRKFSAVQAPVETHHRDARRIYLNPETLKMYKLCTTDAVAITGETFADTKLVPSGFCFRGSLAFAGIVSGLIGPAVIVSNSLLLTAHIESGQYARIFPLSGSAAGTPPSEMPSLRQAQEAATIALREITPMEIYPLHAVSDHPSESKTRDWLPLLLREYLVGLKYITSRQVVEVSYESRRRRFTLTSVKPKGSSESDIVGAVTRELGDISLDAAPQIWLVTWDTDVSITATGQAPEDELQSLYKPEIEILDQKSTNDAYSSVGGLERQISEIRDLLEIPFTRPDLFHYFGLKPPRGILLHGPPGTGKTHLARAIASSTRSSVLVINGPELSSAYHGETESKLRDVFKEARQRSPCIVVLDEIDALAPRREESAGNEVEKRVVATLLTILDGMEDGGKQAQDQVVVIGTTNRPNAIDPALRRPGRFDREIEIGVPDAEARFSILKVLLAKTPYSISDEELRGFASRAHGYVGADLGALVREAGTNAIKRWMATSSRDPNDLPPNLTLSELMAALPSVRPSAMRSLFVETPQVRYSDIGGQADVIQKLREAIEWPLMHPEAFKRLGVRAPKGLLLYGPPGCSKTILARACACESGVNFVAVKGPELLNKYVGESERGVREIFRKARAAAPSIIFFDEIDALATSRGSSDTEAGSHEGVLTSLLNEMDGVQELIGVTIIAATNRPEVIDSALMRPGRLDRILYVGPPDQAGREEIFRIKTKNMSIEPSFNIEQLAKLCEGCSGAEITALCQEAAIMEMKKDINAPFVTQDSFVAAARTMKRQITQAVLEKYSRWRNDSEIRDL